MRESYKFVPIGYTSVARPECVPKEFVPQLWDMPEWAATLLRLPDILACGRRW